MENLVRVLSVNEVNELIKDLYMDEEFKKHPFIENVYVSRSGKVVSIALNRNEPVAYFKSIYKNSTTGYEQCSFRRDGVGVYTYVHLLVLETYNPKPNNVEDLVADHINDDRTDNRLENLQWLTRTDNLKKRDASGSLYKKVYIYDITENDYTIYDVYESRILAAKTIDMFRSNLTKYIKTGKVARDRYFICDYVLTQKEYEEVIKNRQYIRKIVNNPSTHDDDKVCVYNRKTKKVTIYDSKEEAAKDLGLQRSNIVTAIKYGNIIRHDYYITESDYLLDSDYEYIFKEYDLKVARRNGKGE